MIKSKHSQVWDSVATVGVIRSGVIGCVNDLTSPTIVVFSK